MSCDFREEAVELVVLERERQLYRTDGTEKDRTHTRNDWVALVATYIGRAAVANRNARESFRDNMVKAAALCLAALEANLEGNC